MPKHTVHDMRVALKVEEEAQNCIFDLVPMKSVFLFRFTEAHDTNNKVWRLRSANEHCVSPLGIASVSHGYLVLGSDCLYGLWTSITRDAFRGARITFWLHKR